MNATSENNSPATAFPPMATAITYFGGDSGNNLNNIIKFTTGVQWEEIQGDVWSVTADTVDSRSGPGAIWGGLASFAEILGVASGQVSIDNILNQGQLPPDPYDNGPYENRVMGPINRIDKVMKRKAGMAFEWDGLNLVFEYVARPVGGINPKAVLLDILSNFLVMGSASAQFFGGAHRFMANPAKYPFIGGQAGIEKWYKGDFLGWGIETINQFTSPGTGVSTIAGNVLENFQAALSKIFSGDGFDIVGAFSTLMSGASGKIIGAQLARRSGGQIPYLTGLKAILTGEPVGEWHITIGNPLNPIAMIGNLICEGITVEFNEELGPDDFPTEMKITVKLKHAMARDRDAIESVFNRGMGRIYSLPESFKGSADFTTGVDKVTEKDLKDGTTGQVPNQTFGIKYTGRGGRYINPKQIEGSKLSIVSDETSVWNRASFNFGISANSSQQFVNELNNTHDGVIYDKTFALRIISRYIRCKFNRIKYSDMFNLIINAIKINKCSRCGDDISLHNIIGLNQIDSDFICGKHLNYGKLGDDNKNNLNNDSDLSSGIYIRTDINEFENDIDNIIESGFRYTDMNTINLNNNEFKPNDKTIAIINIIQNKLNLNKEKIRIEVSGLMDTGKMGILVQSEPIKVSKSGIISVFGLNEDGLVNKFGYKPKGAAPKAQGNKSSGKVTTKDAYRGMTPTERRAFLDAGGVVK